MLISIEGGGCLIFGVVVELIPFTVLVLGLAKDCIHHGVCVCVGGGGGTCVCVCKNSECRVRNRFNPFPCCLNSMTVIPSTAK